MNSTTNTTPSFQWQEDKRLRSGDKVWFISDAKTFMSAMYGQSRPQTWYRVGGLDLSTTKLGYFHFSSDDSRAMAKAGLDLLPWKVQQSRGIELTRHSHGSQNKGRFRETVALIELEPVLLAQGPALRSYFENVLGFRGNTKPGVWNAIEVWAARENEIEKGALAMVDWFSAGELKEALGENVNVTPILVRLVKEGRLKPNGKKKRGARYMVAQPEVTERLDWTGQ
jgi:hypothetical protein